VTAAGQRSRRHNRTITSCTSGQQFVTRIREACRSDRGIGRVHCFHVRFLSADWTPAQPRSAFRGVRASRIGRPGPVCSDSLGKGTLARVRLYIDAAASSSSYPQISDQTNRHRNPTSERKVKGSLVDKGSVVGDSRSGSWAIDDAMRLPV
jgi:hypothetical protein